MSILDSAPLTNPEIIKESNTTLQNSFYIKLIGEDYTLGKAIEFVLYNNYYSMDDSKPVNFCGFRKPHPHINESLIRIAFREQTEKSTVVSMLLESAKSVEKVFQSIAEDFKPAE